MMSMRAEFIFLNSTQKNRGSHGQAFVPQINSHIASRTHAARRKNGKSIESHTKVNATIRIRLLDSGVPRGKEKAPADAERSQEAPKTERGSIFTRPPHSDADIYINDQNDGNELEFGTSWPNLHSYIRLAEEQVVRSPPFSPLAPVIPRRQESPASSSQYLCKSQLDKNADLCSGADSSAAEPLNDYASFGNSVEQPSSMDRALMASCFDPSIQLPIDVSTRERSLLHFWLSEGRSIILGVSKTTRYCAALEAAQTLIQKCPVYVLTHVVMGESVLCMLTGKPLPKTFFRRRAEMYSAARVILNDQDVSFQRKLFALIQLAVAEFTIGIPHQRKLHLKAIDTLVESKGGIFASMSLQDKRKVEMEPYFYVLAFMRTEISIDRLSDLENIFQRFLVSLKRIRAWESVVQIQPFRMDDLASLPMTDTDRQANGLRLTSLTSYLQFLIRKQLIPMNLPYSLAAAPFFLCYNICMTFIEFQSDAHNALDYLIRLQDCMRKSTKTSTSSRNGGEALLELEPGATAHLLPCMRKEMPAARSDPDKAHIRELRISQASVDALKIFSLQSHASRLRITNMLLQVALVMTNSVLETDDYYNDDAHLELLRNEVIENWLMKPTS